MTFFRHPLPSKFYNYFILFCLFLIGFATATSASISVANDYLIELPNNGLVFVMLASDTSLQRNDLFIIEEPSIREKYLSSGLYDLNEPDDPLWTIDWYSSEHNVHITSDGKHLIRVGGDSRHDTDLGIAFYENGNLIKRYPLSNLAKRDLFLYQHRHWPPSSSKIGDNEQLFTVERKNGSKIIFDIESGELVSGRLVGIRNQIFTAVWLVAFFSIFIGLPLYGLYRFAKFLYKKISRKNTV